MNKFLLGVGAALMIAAGGISLASAAKVLPPISKSPTVRVKYELFKVDTTDVEKRDVEKLVPLQSNTVVFTPINGSYAPAPEITYWMSQPSYGLAGEYKFADLNYGIKFTLTPQKWDAHQTYVVNLNGVVGDGLLHAKDEDIALAVTLNPGEQTTPLSKMFTLKTTIEEIQFQ